MFPIFTRLFSWPFRFFFGDDIFISYAREKGTSYSAGLANRLAEKGYSCRLDQWETSPGEQLPPQQIRALRWSKMLVLLATPAAARSENVAFEIKEFLKTGGVIIPIDLGGFHKDAIWHNLVKGLPATPETTSVTDTTSTPSEEVLNRIINSISFTKRQRRIERSAMIAGFILITAMLVSSVLTFRVIEASAKVEEAMVRIREANKKVIEITKEATKQSEIAKKAGQEAETAKGKEKQATIEAQKQTIIAKKRKNEADIATALAQKQTQIAAKSRKETESMEINTSILEMKFTEPLNAQKRARKSIQSYLNSPNPLSAQLLGEALTSANHFVKRFSLEDEKPVVSSNGLFIASWKEKDMTITIYKLGEVLEKQWSFQIDKLLSPFFVQALAISNDGIHVGFSGRKVNINGYFEDETELNIIEKVKNSENNINVLLRHRSKKFTYNSLTFSPNGKYLCGIDSSREVYPLIYSIENETNLLTLPIPKDIDKIVDIQISPSSKFVGLLTLSKINTEKRDSRVYVYNLPDLTLESTFSCPDDYSFAISFGPEDKDLLIAGSQIPGSSSLLNPNKDYPKSIFLLVSNWKDDEREFTPIGGGLIDKVLPGARRFVFVTPQIVALLRETNFDISGSDTRATGRASIIRNYKEIPEMVGEIVNPGYAMNLGENSGDITSIGILGKEGFPVTSDRGGNIVIWKPFWDFSYSDIAFKGYPYEIFTSKQNSSVFFAERIMDENENNVNKIRIHKLGKLEKSPLQSTIQLEIDKITEFLENDPIAFSSEQELVAFFVKQKKEHSVEPETSLNIYSLRSGFLIRTLNFKNILTFSQKNIKNISFSPDGRFIFAITDKSQLLEWDLQSNQEAPILKFDIGGENLSRSQILFGNNSSFMVLSTSNKVAILKGWESNNLKLVEVIETSSSVDSISISPNDKLLAIGVSDGKITIWQNWTTKQKKVLRIINSELTSKFHKLTSIYSVVFHPFDENIIAILDHNWLKVFNLRMNDPLIRLPRKSETTFNLVFSPDGDYLISTCTSPPDLVFWLWRPEDLIKDAYDGFLFPETTRTKTH